MTQAVGGAVPGWRTADSTTARRTSGTRPPASFSRREPERIAPAALARYLDVQEEPGFRPELVDQARAHISRGTYDTSDRLDGAMQALLRDLYA
jgi:hypothetical protein